MNKFKIGILGNFKQTCQAHGRMDTAFEDLQDQFGFCFDWIPIKSLAGCTRDILKEYQGIVSGSGLRQGKEGLQSYRLP
jgi:hypothetical protein